MGKVFGIISLICGIVGFFGWLLFALIPFVLPFSSYYFPAAAIIFGIIGLIADESKGMAIAGLVLGIVGIVFIIFILPMLILFGLLAFLGSLV